MEQLSILGALMILQQRQIKGYGKKKGERASEGIKTQPAEDPYPLVPSVTSNTDNLLSPIFDLASRLTADCSNQFPSFPPLLFILAQTSRHMTSWKRELQMCSISLVSSSSRISELNIVLMTTVQARLYHKPTNTNTHLLRISYMQGNMEKPTTANLRRKSRISQI